MSVLHNEKSIQLTSIALVTPRLTELKGAMQELQTRLNNVVTILEGINAPCAVGIAQDAKPVRGGLIGEIDTQLCHIENTIFGCEHLLNKAEQLVGKPIPKAPVGDIQMPASVAPYYPPFKEGGL